MLHMFKDGRMVSTVVAGFQAPVAAGKNEGSTGPATDVVTHQVPVVHPPASTSVASRFLSPTEEAMLREEIRGIAIGAATTAAQDAIAAKAKELQEQAPLWTGTLGRAIQLGGVAAVGAAVFVGGKMVYNKITGKPPAAV